MDGPNDGISILVCVAEWHVIARMTGSNCGEFSNGIIVIGDPVLSGITKDCKFGVKMSDFSLGVEGEWKRQEGILPDQLVA